MHHMPFNIDKGSNSAEAEIISPRTVDPGIGEEQTDTK